MSESNRLVGTPRETFGKGAARKLRANGMTPVVMYGHGAEPVHASVESHPLSLIVRQANAIIELDISGKDHLVLVKDVQRDPVRQVIEHVDLIVVKKGEAVEVEVPITIIGTSFSGTTTLQELNTLRMSVPATKIPEHLEVSVEGLEEGSQVHASDIELPKGATLLDDPATVVANVVVPRGSLDEDEATTADEAEGAEAADEDAAE